MKGFKPCRALLLSAIWPLLFKQLSIFSYSSIQSWRHTEKEALRFLPVWTLSEMESALVPTVSLQNLTKEWKYNILTLHMKCGILLKKKTPCHRCTKFWIKPCVQPAVGLPCLVNRVNFSILCVFPYFPVFFSKGLISAAHSYIPLFGKRVLSPDRTVFCRWNTVYCSAIRDASGIWDINYLGGICMSVTGPIHASLQETEQPASGNPSIFQKVSFVLRNH